ncbi:MAG: polyprenyl diphosphate synthase [Bacillota bacterium]
MAFNGKASERTIRHVAIIMDGNGRWARRRGLPRFMGHKEGVKRLREIFECCSKAQIPYLTLYAFSTENWSRPPEEVDFLMELFCETIERELPELTRKRIRLNFIGDESRLPDKLKNTMARVRRVPAEDCVLTVNIAVNYGGRDEIIRACRKICRDRPEHLDQEEFAKYLDSAGQPDPDLLIRTSGEYRISNFLIWQLAYAEFYFTRVLWPDFTAKEFRKAINEYAKRERRFGGIRRC